MSVTSLSLSPSDDLAPFVCLSVSVLLSRRVLFLSRNLYTLDGVLLYFTALKVLYV